MPLKSALAILLILIVSYGSIAQNEEYALVLRKLPIGKRIQYKLAEPIMFLQNDTVYLDTITQIDSNRFQLKDSRWYSLNDIRMVYDIQGRPFIRNGAIKFPAAGILFFSLTTLNQALSHNKPLIIREHLIPSLALVALGVVMFPFRYQHYKLKRHWELITVPI